MPRTARIDIPGLLQHVIVRGIERREIFVDDSDRQYFVERLSFLLGKTGTDCFAWSLMSNHFHLLLRPRNANLAALMRRLLTGYAVRFNLLHNRSGHLFQNRYKSIVCDEDEYLLELVRYIHLNPLRAGLVTNVEGLGRFPWSGHSVVMGRGEMPGQDVDSVLSLFGKRRSEARSRYRLYIQNGVAQGKRSELVGQRAGGSEESPEAVRDARILGDDGFVGYLQTQEALKERVEVKMSLTEIVERVAKELDIPKHTLSPQSRSPVAVKARALVCHLALAAGHSAASIGRHVGMSRYGVSVAGRRGKALIEDSHVAAGLATGEVN
jgi:REP-associated tyrosine transposase